jgi:hypothetical protein
MPELCESPGFPSSSPALDVAILIFASLWVTGCNLRIRTKNSNKLLAGASC